MIIIKTKVISAFPCCGKSYAFKNSKNYSILDSDSSDFSWCKDAEGNPCRVRNPSFPQNYIQHIKDNIGKVDIIFVSSHKEVRVALDDANIRYCTVYPKEDMLNEWVGRMYLRGSDDEFMRFIIRNWDMFMYEIWHENNHGFGIHRLGNNEFISGSLDFLYNW
jgi:hypothetical protein